MSEPVAKTSDTFAKRKLMLTGGPEEITAYIHRTHCITAYGTQENGHAFKRGC